MVLAMKAPSRRTLLVGAAWGLLGGGLALAGRLVGAAVGRRPPRARRVLAAGPAAAIVPGGQRAVGEVIVIRDERGYAAVSSRCTHLGCTITSTARGFECPCHGSSFARDGRVVWGPATSDLPWYRVTLGRDGDLRVDLDAVVTPDERLVPEGVA